MKAINLISLINAKNNLSEEVLKSYLNQFEMKDLKEKEFETLESLVNEINKIKKKPICNMKILEQYYVGYTISQISKEFDLLRIGKDSILNIELKSASNYEKIKKQLIQNKYYLSFLKKDLFCFTYVLKENKLFYLNMNDEIEEISINFLIEKLGEQELIEIEDINNLFDPCNYLVSPFNSTEEFISGKYFLTDHQINIKKDILKLIEEPNFKFIAIEGVAGTGKTLLTYDIAKDLKNNFKKVIIFHCGKINDGQIKLIEIYNWNISSIKDYRAYNVKNYDLVIIDEVQRIHQEQLDSLIDDIKESNGKCIFSFDGLQCLIKKEIDNNIPKYIKDKVLPNHFELTEKIRTNKEIASFIKNLFDLNKENLNIKYNNISVQYFSNNEDAINYREMLSKKNDWKVIEYTPSAYEYYPYNAYQYGSYYNAHKVIGQEYDNVIAMMDETFYYRDDGLLTVNINTYYHMTKMLFQILTRARKKICIIIINNQDLLEICMKILHNEHIPICNIKNNFKDIKIEKMNLAQ